MSILNQVKSGLGAFAVVTLLAACGGGGGSEEGEPTTTVLSASGSETFELQKRSDNPKKTADPVEPTDNANKTNNGKSDNVSVEPVVDNPIVIQEVEYDLTQGPDINPLKGWNASWWRSFPESSVGFQYIAWGDFEPEHQQFDFGEVDKVMERPGSTGRHMILRLYCDWDGLNKPTASPPFVDGALRGRGCPSWLYGNDPDSAYAGPFVDRIEYTDKDGQTRYVTDFNSAAFLDRAQEAMAALVGHLKDNPRTYVVQLGIIGYWGEWHTTYATPGQFAIDNPLKDANYNRNDDRVFPTSKRIFYDWVDAIENTSILLMGRYPSRKFFQATFDNGALDDELDGEFPDYPIGFHNDFFVAGHSHSASFDNAVAADQLWRNGPIGGEVPPRSDAQAQAETPVLYGSDGEPSGWGDQVIASAGYSTMAPGAYRPSILDANGDQVELPENSDIYPLDTESPYYEDYLRQHRLMGYNFQLQKAVFPVSVPLLTPVDVRLDVKNVGVARMYKNWELQAAFLNNENLVLAQKTVEFNTDQLMPDEMVSLSFDLDNSSLTNGTYRLAVRLIQPGADSSKVSPWGLLARNTYIEFANDLEVVPGQWNELDQSLEGGWSILGEVMVSESAAQ